jgi:hypothetical protein
MHCSKYLLKFGSIEMTPATTQAPLTFVTWGRTAADRHATANFRYGGDAVAQITVFGDG